MSPSADYTRRVLFSSDSSGLTPAKESGLLNESAKFFPKCRECLFENEDSSVTGAIKCCSHLLCATTAVRRLILPSAVLMQRMTCISPLRGKKLSLKRGSYDTPRRFYLSESRGLLLPGEGGDSSGEQTSSSSVASMALISVLPAHGADAHLAAYSPSSVNGLVSKQS